MVKREINIDEKWPVFSLDEPRNENGPFVVEINEEFYKEYCYFMYKYHEYQLRMQRIYEYQQSEFNNKNIGQRFPEDSVIDTEFKPNKIRKPDVSEENVRAVSSENNE